MAAKTPQHHSRRPPRAEDAELSGAGDAVVADADTDEAHGETPGEGGEAGPIDPREPGWGHGEQRSEDSGQRTEDRGHDRAYSLGSGL